MDIISDVAAIEAQTGPDWHVVDGMITKSIDRGDFDGALAYVNAVGRVAAEIDHHPDIDIRWGVVTMYCSTHSSGGITDYDINLTRLIDALDANSDASREKP